MLNLNCELKKQDFGEYTYISYLQKDGLIKKLSDEGIGDKILKLSDKDGKADEVSPGYLVPTKDLLDYFNKIIQIESLGLYPIIETLLDKFKSKGANFFINSHEKAVCTISKGDYIVRFQDDMGNLASIFLTGEFDLHYEGNLSRLLNIGNYFYNLFENFSSEIKYKLLVSLIDEFKSARDEFLQVRAELTPEELSKASEIWPYVTMKMENNKLISIKYYNVDIPILSSFLLPGSPIADITDRNSLNCDIKNLTLAKLALCKAIELYSKLIKVR